MPDPSSTGLWQRVLRTSAFFSFAFLVVYFKIPLCAFAWITGHPCPGCGLTRATLALLRGDLHGALLIHPLSPVLAPLGILGVAYNTISYLRDGRPHAFEELRGRGVSVAALALVIATMGVWIARFAGAFGGPISVHHLD